MERHKHRRSPLSAVVVKAPLSAEETEELVAKLHPMRMFVAGVLVGQIPWLVLLLVLAVAWR